ncbi:MAG: GIY-YIG nuclease family protein [Chlamydiia bacterium]|nr:GIY-YIG nuclease family protein [Chlamydiia bacterium]
MTPGGGAKKRVIYVFRNKRTGELLIGKTAQTVQRRISQYNSAFNTSKKGYNQNVGGGGGSFGTTPPIRTLI